MDSIKILQAAGFLREIERAMEIVNSGDSFTLMIDDGARNPRIPISVTLDNKSTYAFSEAISKALSTLQFDAQRNLKDLVR